MNGASDSPTTATFQLGSDRLFRDSSSLIAGKRVGVLTNHTGRLSDGRSIIDAIADSGICTLHSLYGPEHGIAGDTPDGKVVEHALHPRYDVQVYSLYGKTHKPTAEMLNGVDVLVCDILPHAPSAPDDRHAPQRQGRGLPALHGAARR
jgi:uncharacterized protein YbbC (DUF1343 family)